MKVLSKVVREPVFSGSWYPADKDSLNSAIDGYLSGISKIDFKGAIRAIIVPHAGYAFSGKIAALSFRQLNNPYSTVFVLGPSHQCPLTGVALLNVTHFATPLGEIAVSKKQAKMLSGFIKYIPEAHKKEHSIEMEIPFIQKCIPDAEIIPMVVGEVDSGKLKDSISSILDNNDLIVVSADLSHYHPYDEAVMIDSGSIANILRLDYNGILESEVDASHAVSALLRLAKERGWKPFLVFYANSGDVTGDKSAVVGYSSIVFLDNGEKVLTVEDQKFLLKNSRKAIVSHLKGKDVEVPKNLPLSLAVHKGCFVTLHKNGELRGCIGNIYSDKMLFEAVLDNSINAAFKDPRFPPVSFDELDDIEIEISVLSFPERLKFSSANELMNKLMPFVDGVVLRNGNRSSTFLPQVWEQLSSKEEFLSALCFKGGMHGTCWTSPSTEVYTYQAFVFSESQL